MTSKEYPRVLGLTKWRRAGAAVLMSAGLLACCLSASAQSEFPVYEPECLVPAVPWDGWCFEARAEYLLWWTSGMNVPALVTSSPVGTARGEAGVLGLPTTEILFGDTAINSDARSGGRFAIDGWFDASRSWGFELGCAFLDETSTSSAASSQGDPILARPFANTDTGFQDAGLIAYPNVAQGNISIDAATRFGTAEAMFVTTLLADCDRRVWVRVGYRYAELKDQLTISEVMVSTDTATAGTTLDLLDRFTTKNTFNGAQFGLVAQRQMDCWSLELLTMVALGGTHSTADIQGTTTTQSSTGSSSTASGGFLALPSNIGHYEKDAFSGMTELGLKLTYSLDCRWRVSFGYSFLYWYHVARAGDQVDTRLSANALPPSQSTTSKYPVFPFTTTGFWAQGLTAGLEYRF